MIPASYLFKDVHERHWGVDAPNGPKAEDAYYASVGSGPVAILRLLYGVGDAAQAVLASARHPRAPQVPNETACRT
jgi:hypothetical protein